jgi:hypothetical protein
MFIHQQQKIISGAKNLPKQNWPSPKTSILPIAYCCDIAAATLN